MSRILAFIAGAAAASVAPVAAQQVDLMCRPVVRAPVNCTPNYNRLPLECNRS